ncbi:MAG: class B sortase [Ruminococcaceae bacterium]|nr:class B sortase [Oscillospiraceae bacterium]
MGKKKKNAKKKQAVIAVEGEQSEQTVQEPEQTEASTAEPVVEQEPSYEELFADDLNAEDRSQDDEKEALRNTLRLSISESGRRELAGKQKIRIPISRILSKLLWTAVVFALVAVIVWQSAEVVVAKIEYQRSNRFYIDLSNQMSLSKGQTGMNSTLYGEKGISGTPDYEDMKNGAVIIDKQTLTSAEKKELAVYNAKLAALKKQNPDTVGWIYIPGTNIDYPIVMPPIEDPEYYMDHSFSGANYSSGAIFIETRCRPGILLNKNTIIVGHNIRLQGMMFNQLVKFGEEKFFNEHTEVYVYTEEGKFVFNLFSFYKVNQNYNFRRVSFSSDGQFLQYLEAMRQNSYYYREGIRFSPDDRIITMYTCTNDNIKTNRYVAVAVLEDCLLNE